MKFLLFSLLPLVYLSGQTAEQTRWEQQASKVTIIRDGWGVPHIYGESDADAIFGMLYAQSEDDFKRVERNYIDALGRMSEAYGEEYLFHDLRARMFMDESRAKEHLANSPEWLQKLCNAFADGINYFLATHPEVKPDLITRFEPWMPFYFSEGSIGGDITRISLSGLEAFYGQGKISQVEDYWDLDTEPVGSNGFAIGPERSVSGNSLFLINPHTSFYFRTETHVNSQEGLQAYGAATWGQFFIYQGFNEDCGWMHTSTYADAIDLYREKIEKNGDRVFYRYGKELRPVENVEVAIQVRSGSGLEEKKLSYYKTHHGPVIRREGDDWITFRMMERPVDALRQSFLRTKAKGYGSFKKTMKIRTNSSNNTVYADRDGNIGYWHGNFIPRRDPSFDYSGLIDGSTPATDWQGLHKLKQTLHVKNPAGGWIQNCNSTPFTSAGTYSPDQADFPTYMAPDRENYRGINAVRVLDRQDQFTLADLVNAANDPYLSAFEVMIPDLVEAYKNSKSMHEASLSRMIDLLSKWDFNYGTQSIETAVAIYWAEQILPMAAQNTTSEIRRSTMMADMVNKHTSNEEKILALSSARDKLTTDFGQWKTEWGHINRFQRLSGAISEIYDDELASIPVGFTSSRWGSLASYGARSYDNTVRRYGTGGNSFVAVVEFGDRLIAKSVVSGGQSGDPDSPHFTDQAEKFCRGDFKDVYYYPEDVRKNGVKTYRPGAR